jgi:hypothetical protein
MNKNSILYGALFACGLGLTGSALADNGNAAIEAADARALLAVKVSAVQAAEAAEAKIGGKTSSVSFETHAEGASAPFYHVEVITPEGAQQDIAVDATSGEVVKLLSLEHGQNGDDGEMGADDQDQDGDGEQ